MNENFIPEKMPNVADIKSVQVKKVEKPKEKIRAHEVNKDKRMFFVRSWSTLYEKLRDPSKVFRSRDGNLHVGESLCSHIDHIRTLTDPKEIQREIALLPDIGNLQKLVMKLINKTTKSREKFTKEDEELLRRVQARKAELQGREKASQPKKEAQKPETPKRTLADDFHAQFDQEVAEKAKGETTEAEKRLAELNERIKRAEAQLAEREEQLRESTKETQRKTPAEKIAEIEKRRQEALENPEITLDDCFKMMPERNLHKEDLTPEGKKHLLQEGKTMAKIAFKYLDGKINARELLVAYSIILEGQGEDKQSEQVEKDMAEKATSHCKVIFDRINQQFDEEKENVYNQ